MLALPPPRFMPCDRCGASVERQLADEHVCDEERRLDYLVVQLGEEIAGFEAELDVWLRSPQGRFARFYAERESGSMNG